jgi:hypothetical protein
VRRFIVTGVIVAAAAILTVTPALAGKGGNGGHSSGATTAGATLSATPNPARVGSNVLVSGCGYDMAPAQLTIVGPSGASQTLWVGMWSTGCLDTAYFAPSQAGTYTISVAQGGGALATTSVSVSG